MRLSSLCRFARFETMISSLPSIKFDIKLQNFKKLLDIFSPQIIERKRSKDYLVIILPVKESLEQFSFERKKFGLICFPRICFLGLIYCDQEPLCLLYKIEDYFYFLCVHIGVSTRCKIWFTLGLFANCFSLKLLSLSLKSHMNVL